MRYLVTIGPKQALRILTDINEVVGEPTEDSTKEDSRKAGVVAHKELQERLDGMSEEEAITFFSSLVTLNGVIEGFSSRVAAHLKNFTIHDVWSNQ